MVWRNWSLIALESAHQLVNRWIRLRKIFRHYILHLLPRQLCMLQFECTLEKQLFECDAFLDYWNMDYYCLCITDSHFTDFCIECSEVDLWITVFETFPNLFNFILDLLGQSVFKILCGLISADFFAAKHFYPFKVNVLHQFDILIVSRLGKLRLVDLGEVFGILLIWERL
jgi:hypothetical protein